MHLGNVQCRRETKNVSITRNINNYTRLNMYSIRKEAPRLNSLSRRLFMIYAKLMSDIAQCMHSILSVDCGLLTSGTSRCGKCIAENIGMRSKEARDERIARACSYVRTRHRVCLVHRPQEVNYNI